MLDEHIARFPGPGGYVFSGRGGAQLRPSYIRIHFQRAAEKVGLVPPRLRIHDLRHTGAALLIKQGAHAKEIAETLGHSNIGVTIGHLRAHPPRPG
jgi:integrase